MHGHGFAECVTKQALLILEEHKKRKTLVLLAIQQPDDTLRAGDL